MEKKWTYCAVYSIIQIHFVRGVWKFNAEEDIYALPGSDVNLTCQTQKIGFLVQVQWSKVTDKVDLIALYHPQHGFYCAHARPCESLVAFTETPRNVSKWTLSLRNISSSLSGKYECSFTLYPEGIQTKIYNLLIQTHGTQDEWRSNHTIEIEINQTLEIPCFQNISSEISSEFTFAWLVENNGTQETLITEEHPISHSTLFKDRVKLGADYRLHLSPVQILDNGQTFSCHIRVKPGKILKTSTRVKVFAKPETPMIVEDSMDVLRERTFTCSLKNVFPKANLTWFIDGRFLQDEDEGIYIANEERKGKGGLLELKSVLTRVHSNDPAQSNNLTIWCMALSPVPGNKVWNISSEKITFSLSKELSSVNPPTDFLLSGTESTLGTRPSPADGVSTTRYPATFSKALVDMSTPRPNTTPQTSNSSVTTQGFNYSWTSSGTDAKKPVSWIPSEMFSSSPPDTGSTLYDDVVTNTTTAFSEVPTTINGSTKKNHVHITGTVVNKPKDGMSWPVIVAALLFPCIVLFGLGVRKWYQYQKEIMERPPPFKPPPPPIKYTCIQDPIGSDLPCHEMETL
ncbi:PREDICTED: T-cell surface protein tactile isoform X1 [Propithecus coquereli]|uniref:T-cell surface protein tactile isoform X1 n=1 Tax=Propithecus coquereli TaxID=379532 RepID=UPI00063FB994|nr:PREDICTED: T-cell surface protein tactile isoform X1 [Propithecus coquereli]